MNKAKKYGWIQWRHTFAYGAGEWHYKEEAADTLSRSRKFIYDNVIDNLQDEYSYSDKYRGIEWKKIELPPKEVLLRKAEAAEITSESCLIRAKRYRLQARKAKSTKSKGDKS